MKKKIKSKRLSKKAIIKRRKKRLAIILIVIVAIISFFAYKKANKIEKKEATKTTKKEDTKEHVKLQEATDTEKILSRITDVLGSFETYYIDGTAQAANIENSAIKLNEKLIAPEEEFSVNAAFEPYIEENGYETGGSYSNGEIIQTIGGGICQTSSTLYNALLAAEIKVTERFSHQMLVGYVEPAKDATISDTTQDLKFINNTGDYIRIVAYAQSGVCNMTIYGREYRDPRRSVVYQSVEISEEQPETIYKASEDLPLGQIHEGDDGKRGVVAELWKIELYDGVEKSRTKWHVSTYKKKNKIIKIGIKKADGSISNKLKTIFEAKDNAAMADAISKIQAGQLDEF